MRIDSISTVNVGPPVVVPVPLGYLARSFIQPKHAMPREIKGRNLWIRRARERALCQVGEGAVPGTACRLRDVKRLALAVALLSAVALPSLAHGEIVPGSACATDSLLAVGADGLPLVAFT